MSPLAKRIMILSAERHLTHADRHNRMREMYGVDSVHDLTDEQAQDFIAWLLESPPEPAETPDEMCNERPAK